MNYYILIVIKIIIAAMLAVILGNGSVVAFNRMPSTWFDDDGIPEDIDRRQRITSTPWKYIFVAYFALCGIFLALREPLQYEIAIVVILFIVLEMAIADVKYRTIPDQLSIMLAISAIGLFTVNDVWWEPLAGAGIGLLLSLSVWGLGRLIFKNDSIGGADLKFFVAIGLVMGRTGVITIFVLSTLFAAILAAALVISGRTKIRAKIPLLPCALVAVTVYALFLRDAFQILSL